MSASEGKGGAAPQGRTHIASLLGPTPRTGLAVPEHIARLPSARVLVGVAEPRQTRVSRLLLLMLDRKGIKTPAW